MHTGETWCPILSNENHRIDPRDKNRRKPARGERWRYALGVLIAGLLLFDVYGPALKGPFLLDDYYVINTASRGGLEGVRPLLTLGFWLNFKLSNFDPLSYHVVNMLLHICNSVVVGLIIRKVLKFARIESELASTLSVFAALVFLLHPLQTESVAYISGRSECQSFLLFSTAFVAFLYSQSTLRTLGTALIVSLLFSLACLTKEHAVVLPLLLILTDSFWNSEQSLKRILNDWRFYTPLIVVCAIGFFSVSRVLGTATTAGFGISNLPWHRYFLTQCRAIWVYVRMFALPYGQNIDHDFAVSLSIKEFGTLLGITALIGATLYAWVLRRRFPVASYGWLVFLLLLSPTSSFIPIRDVLVERRVYMPFFGLILIVCELLARWRVRRAILTTTLTVVVLVCSVLTHQRNQLWRDPIAMWSNAVRQSPNKARPHFQLGYAYYLESRCSEALNQYQIASQLDRPDSSLYTDWGLAYDCAGEPANAVEKFRKAIEVEKNSAHPYTLTAIVYAKQQRFSEAHEMLRQAERVEPTFEPTYVYRGNVYLLQREFVKAAEQFRRALRLNPTDPAARNGLDMANGYVVPKL